VAAIMQVLAIFFPEEFSIDASRLQFSVKKQAKAPNAEPDAERDAIKALNDNCAPLLTPEVVDLLFAVWDVRTGSIQYAWGYRFNCLYPKRLWQPPRHSLNRIRLH
jgi:hypothetical protein